MATGDKYLSEKQVLRLRMRSWSPLRHGRRERREQSLVFHCFEKACDVPEFYAGVRGHVRVLADLV